MKLLVAFVGLASILLLLCAVCNGKKLQDGDTDKQTTADAEQQQDSSHTTDEQITALNDTGDGGNGTTNINGTINGTVELPPSTAKTTTPKKEPETKELPNKAAAENEHKSSLTIFFITLVVGICILLVHLLIQTHFHYLPDSIAIVLLGALIGLCLKVFKFGNWKQEEALSPTVFFIVLLPPIIFESGYNLHKGNFFQNIGSILVFAVLGTVISAVVVGGGVYLLGQAQVVYPLTKIESFAFGSLISAVDPVATLAIFQALDVDPILYMLVFGESVLNDAVSIVLTTTVLELSKPDAAAGSAAFLYALWRFCVMFFASAAIGVVFGLVSAMLLKFVDLHKTPSLEFGLVLIFSYMPYALAEGIHQSGIMAILCCGIVMSHYTHFNLSPVTQITVQQTFRTMAFVCETCVFAYLGLAIFSFRVSVKPAFCIWSVVLILIGRAVNIFPLSFMLNFFREHKITRKNQFIMWFSGLRGAVAFALSLHLSLENNEKRYVLVTATLIIVLFTIMFLGGSTMPLLKFMNKYSATDRRRRRRKSHKDVTMSKTKEMSKIVDREYLSELTTEEELEVNFVKPKLKDSEIVDSEHLSELTTEEEFEVNFVKPHLKGFMKWDAKYLVPFFTRRFTQKEVKEGRSKVDSLTRKWYKEVRAAPSESEDEGDGVRGGGGGSLLQMEETSLMTPSTSHNNNGGL